MNVDIIYNENCITGLAKLPDGSIDCCVTSPPYYGLRDYGIEPTYWPGGRYIPMAGLPEVIVPEWTGCLGLEPDIYLFTWHIVQVFREVRRVMKPTGTLWLNFADSYSGSFKGNGMVKDEAYPLQRRNNGSFTAKNFGNILNGLKPKDLIGTPWRVAFALQADGWYLRQDIIWAKSNPMPESVTDRCTKAHEYVFFLTKSRRYFYDAEAIKEDCVQNEFANGFRGGAYCGNETYDNNRGGTRKNVGNYKVPSGWDTDDGAHRAYHRKGRSNSFARAVKESPPPGQQTQHRAAREDVDYSGKRNKRSVWTVATQPYSEAHFATFPEKLIEPCILAGCVAGGVVCDPFMGSGTTAQVATRFGRHFVGYEINPEYITLAEKRTSKVQLHMAGMEAAE